jgi:chromosome segregation ATPase
MILSNTPARRDRWAVAVLLAAGLLVLPVVPGLADDVPKPTEEPPAGEPGETIKLQLRFANEPKEPADEPAKRADLRSRAVNEPAAVTPADVARLRDEVELLEAAGDTKKAHVRAAEVAVRTAQEKFEFLASMKKKGYIAEGEVSTARNEIEAATAQLDVRKAELNEHLVKVKQAKRRLDATQGATRPAADATDLPRKRAPGALDAGLQRLGAAERDKLKLDAAKVQNQLARTEEMVKMLADQRKLLAAELKNVTDKQAALTADMVKLKQMLDELKKNHPDAAGPQK